MKDLFFSHQFATGRSISLSVKRTPGKKPKVTSSIRCELLTSAELAEYEPWRNNVVASLMSILTPEEVFASL